MQIIPLADNLTAIVMRNAGVECVLVSLDHHLPVIVHWGPDLGDLPPEGIGALIQATRQHVVGNPVDALMEVSVVPEQARGWLGTPGVVGSRTGAGFSPSLLVTCIESADPDPAWPSRIRVRAEDQDIALGMTVEIEQSVAGLLRMRASLTNNGAPYQLDALTLAYPVPDQATHLMDFTGHWAKERVPQTMAFSHGLHARESRHGRTGFDAAHILLAGTQFSNRTGTMWGTHVGWSGNHREFAEKTIHSVSVIGGGELLSPGEIQLTEHDSYTSPWVYGCFSDTGLDGISDRFHTTLRARANHLRTTRPVTLNSWQAVYFNHDIDKLKELATLAAQVGVERFVLDDGWFASRRDDTSGLGDWFVSPDVWPDGLTPLTDHVTSLGMEFGLWFEPEMVNPDSDLARAHPDWILGLPTRLSPDTRHQQVLNLSVPEAYAAVLDAVDSLVSAYPIAYIKWDHNRDLVEAGDRTTGRPRVHEQTLAAYRLMDELKAHHRSLEIESCSSGGGRIDLGMADHVERFWVSDDIDALERQQITRWTNLLIPFDMLGTHAEEATSHTTGRTLDLDFRAATALFGHTGLEWDLTACDETELAQVKAWIDVWKQTRDLIATGTSVHADLPDPTLDLHGVVSPDRRIAIYEWVDLATSQNIRPGLVLLPGLDPTIFYHVGLLKPDQASDSPALWGGPVAWVAPEGAVVPGSVLTSAGLAMPVLRPQHSLLMSVQAI